MEGAYWQDTFKNHEIHVEFIKNKKLARQKQQYTRKLAACFWRMWHSCFIHWLLLKFDSYIIFYIIIFAYYNENIKQYHIVNGNKMVPSAYFNGSLSSAHKQEGNLLKAEQVSMEGLTFRIDDNWLQHSLIHSRYFQKIQIKI